MRQGRVDSRHQPSPPRRRGDLRILLVGYNGANNTGSEARLLSIIDDVRTVFGPTAHITVPTLNEQNLRRYLHDEPHLRIEPVPSIFFFALKRLVRQHDFILLVEGSCFMDTWTSVLLTAFLWTIHYAHKMGKPCIAYAVDVGDLSQRNKDRVLHELDHLSMTIIRSTAAAERLKNIGYTKPIKITADCAYTFQPKDNHKTLQSWPQSTTGAIGLAPVDYYLWPVRVQLWGPDEHCYRWPYYYPRSPERKQGSENLATGWAAEMDRLIERHDKNVALLCMEQLDEPLTQAIRKRMNHADRAAIFSSKDYNASQMTIFLRSLDFLITSRYHASILSMATPVPQIAVGHDTRLRNLYQDLGLIDSNFIDSTSPQLWHDIRQKIDTVMQNTTPLTDKLRSDYTTQLNLAQQNQKLLKDYAQSLGWDVTP